MCSIVNQPRYRCQHQQYYDNDCWNKINSAKHSIPQSSVNNLIKNIKIERNKFGNVNKLKNVNECGIILFNQDFSKLLIVYQNVSHKWGFPKGKMFDNEKQYGLYYDCASREMLEETGVCLKHYRKKYKKINGNESSIIIKNKIFFILSTDSVHVRNCYPSDTEEIGQTRWINTNELSSFIKNKNCNITLRYIYDYMIDNTDNCEDIITDIEIHSVY
jgi:8-oxo-dGTP pyrophosphatase MutT (NUDIX family)